jgi:hypothetical protein
VKVEVVIKTPFAHHAHFALRPALAAPGGHGGRIVDGDAPHLVDTFGFELVAWFYHVLSPLDFIDGAVIV